MEILLVGLGLVLFVCLVLVHEWGHFIMARRGGVEVEEFGAGFPPKMFKIYTDKKGTEYTWNWLPLGGFVRLKGEHDMDHQKGSFGAARFSTKVKIMLAGVTMNLFTAWLMLTLLALVGIPKLPLPGGVEQFSVKSDTKITRNDVYVGYVEKDGPADKAGLKTGDKIKYVLPVFTDGRTIPLTCPGLDSSDWRSHWSCTDSASFAATDVRSDVELALKDGADSVTVAIVGKSDGQEKSLTVTPRSLQEVADSEKTDDPKGYIGIQPYDYTVQRSTWSAPIVGAGLVVQYTKLTLSALGNTVLDLFKGHAKEASQNVSGPVGIFVVLRDGASFGITYILLVIALLSLTLAIMNALPIPALDGGKLWVMLLFRAIKRPLTPSLEEKIHGTGFITLMALFVLITIVDVKRFF